MKVNRTSSREIRYKIYKYPTSELSKYLLNIKYIWRRPLIPCKCYYTRSSLETSCGSRRNFVKASVFVSITSFRQITTSLPSCFRLFTWNLGSFWLQFFASKKKMPSILFYKKLFKFFFENPPLNHDLIWFNEGGFKVFRGVC